MREINTPSSLQCCATERSVPEPEHQCCHSLQPEARHALSREVLSQFREVEDCSACCLAELALMMRVLFGALDEGTDANPSL